MSWEDMFMPVSTMTGRPVTVTFCQCLQCQEKNEGILDGGEPNMRYNGVGGHYGTRQWRPHGRGPTYLGMENEIGGAGDRAWRVAFGYLGKGLLAEAKPDGHLLETTTHPASVTAFMKYYPWDMLAELQATGAHAEAGGGIHIHVNKDGFDDAGHIFRWLSVIHSNPRQMSALGGRRGYFEASPTRDTLWTIAHRTAAQAAHAKAVHHGVVRARKRGGMLYLLPEDEEQINMTATQTSSLPYSSNYGSAVTPTRHVDTFEVRFPQGSVNPAEVATRYQLIGASVEYARQDTDNGNPAFDAFQAYVNAHRRTYGALARSMAEL